MARSLWPDHAVIISQLGLTPAKKAIPPCVGLVAYLAEANADDCPGQAPAQTPSFGGMPGRQQQSWTHHCSRPQLLRWLLHPMPGPVHAQPGHPLRPVGMQTLLPRPLHAQKQSDLAIQDHCRARSVVIQGRCRARLVVRARSVVIQSDLFLLHLSLASPKSTLQPAMLHVCFWEGRPAGFMKTVFWTYRRQDRKHEHGSIRGAFVCHDHHWSLSPAYHCVVLHREQICISRQFAYMEQGKLWWIPASS